MSALNPRLIQTAKQLRLKKGLSQNFLVDDTPLAAIVDALSDEDRQLPLVEIGPGGGFLTEKLLEAGFKITAVELDPRMVRYLGEAYKGNPNLTVIHQDVQQVDLAALLVPRGLIIGNIPYHLTGPILFQIVGELDDATHPLRQSLSQVMLLVQKEVADRLLAQPGDSAYGQLTLQAQFWFYVSRVIHVPRESFYPRPAVDSTVIRLVPRTEPAVPDVNLTALSRLIKAAFKHRRKTLLNNLKLSGYGSDTQLQSVLLAAAIPLKSRPQELSAVQYGALVCALDV